MHDDDGALAVSRYALVAPNRYTTHAGHRVGIVWSTRSGQAIVVTAATADALSEGRVPAIGTASRTQLREAEILVSAAEDELQVVLNRFREGSSDRTEREFILMPTAACNMGCQYCGQTHSKGDPGRDYFSRVQKRVLRAAQDSAVRKITVRWFGAEPLLAYRHVVSMGEQFGAECERRGVLYASRIITNGSLLTRRRLVELHQVARIHLFVITIDGRNHDSTRPLKSGRGSYRRILETIAAGLREPRLDDCRFQLRTNVGVDSIDSVEGYLADCAELGLSDPRVNFELAPIHSWNNRAEETALAAAAYADAEVRLLRAMKRLDLRFLALPSSRPKVTCGAVTRSSEVLSPTGHIFSCTEKPLVPAADPDESLIPVTELGDAAPRPDGPYDDWYDSVDRGETWCRGCVMLPTCGGSCPKLWRESGPPCPSFKRNWSDRISLAAEKRGLSLVEPAKA